MVENNNIEQFFQKVASGEAKGSSVYFLGIGGIGMSAIARYFNSRGVRVSGYDKTPTSLTQQLQAEGIAVHFEDNVDLIDKSASLVVYTPAIPSDHQEYNYLIEHQYPIYKRSKVLGWITKNAFNICVAGTHGKTTTSSMIAHILRHSGFGCNAFLGGISGNYNTNFWSNEKNVCVVEADEYDRSFLQLNPDIAVITAMDPDHLDIYETKENFERAFIDFSGRLKQSGTLFYKNGLAQSEEFHCEQKFSYDLKNKSYAFAEGITIVNGAYHFNVTIGKEKIDSVVLNMGGLHNIENAIAAIAVAKKVGIEDQAIKQSLLSYQGVKRRFQYVVKNERLVMIDDYAHHPQELEALINGAKGLYPQKKCLVIFQPHLFSRTRDFANEFATSLKLADEIWLLPIYPAREQPIPGVTSSMIADLMMSDKVKVVSKENILSLLEKQDSIELLITAGAGDIDTLVDPIKNLLNKR